jgi:SAM-dependent methyltransferase
MGEFRRIQLADWIEKFDLTDKRLIEIGCGRGEYLELMRQSGARSLFGIENAHASVEVANAQGFDVRPAYLTPGFFNPWPEPFEAFAVFSFMEHWPDLKGSLSSLRGVLVEGAIGLIEVPNFEFILANGLYSEFTTDHIHYFDRQTLRTALELNGFEVLRIKSVWHDYILSAEVRKRTSLKTESFNTKRQRIVSELHAFTDRFEPGRLVVWGAGHQALAVMSMAQLQERVSHVVDSAAFKQEKYTPGTRLLIKSPESLIMDEPHAIIVMAAAYSDEVAQTIANIYPFIGHVAILREDQLEIVKDA